MERYTRNYFGTPAEDDNPSSTINLYSLDEQDGSNELHCTSNEQDGSHELYNTRYELSGSNELQWSCIALDGSIELHNTPHSDDEFDGYGELDWLDEIDSSTTVDISASEANEKSNHSYLREFSFSDLEIATNNFSTDALLGDGGFGNVYKGWLDQRTFSPSKVGTGMTVAIKKRKRNSKQGFLQWQMEVYILERQCHPNLIKLLGYCGEDEELLLVYEFMPKGSLVNLLFRKNLGIEPIVLGIAAQDSHWSSLGALVSSYFRK